MLATFSGSLSGDAGAPDQVLIASSLKIRHLDWPVGTPGYSIVDNSREWR
jgi:hypothetical protein